MASDTVLALPCPAKLNLFLLITGRRADGYHNLQTLFQLLDYGDELQLQPDDSGELQLGPELAGIAPEQNLVYRAARLLKDATGCRQGARMHLLKRLPQGGGVGGGSSDAATALLGLNALWQTGLSLAQLAQLGRSLGADVPVFVLGRTAWAEGIGELLTPTDVPSRWYVVVSPECAVSTGNIFSHKRLTRNSKPIKVRAFFEEGGRNDCQPLVEQLYPQVKDAVDWLKFFGPAQLTGTGACVFASFSSEQEARDVFAERPTRFKGFVARGVNESPLHQRLRTSVAIGV